MPRFQFPPDDFMPCLIDLYFEQINLFFPLLHRPTFERSVAEGLHHTDYWFGALLLLVCAIGSQYTDDSRVLWEGEVDYRSSGWRWFQQVQLTRQNIPGPPNIYNLQLHCVSSAMASACIGLAQACSFEAYNPVPPVDVCKSIMLGYARNGHTSSTRWRSSFEAEEGRGDLDFGR